MTPHELARSRVPTSHRAAVRALMLAGVEFRPACAQVLQWAREARAVRTPLRAGTFFMHDYVNSFTDGKKS